MLDEAPGFGLNSFHHNHVHRLSEIRGREAVGPGGGFADLNPELAVGLGYPFHRDLVPPAGTLPGRYGNHDVAGEVHRRPVAHAQLGPELRPSIDVLNDHPPCFPDSSVAPHSNAPNLQTGGVAVGVIGGIALLARYGVLDRGRCRDWRRVETRVRSAFRIGGERDRSVVFGFPLCYSHPAPAAGGSKPDKEEDGTWVHGCSWLDTGRSFSWMAQGKRKCTRARTLASPLWCEPDHRRRCSGPAHQIVLALITDVILAAIVLFVVSGVVAGGSWRCFPQQ